jgi:hypothetical protein
MSMPPNSGSVQHEILPPFSTHRISAESSSESEASGIINSKKDSKEKDKKGVFRIFSKKKSKNQP